MAFLSFFFFFNFFSAQRRDTTSFLTLLAEASGETVVTKTPFQHSKANCRALCARCLLLKLVFHLPYLILLFDPPALGRYPTLQSWVNHIPRAALAPATHCNRILPSLARTLKSLVALFAARSDPRSGAATVPARLSRGCLERIARRISLTQVQ